MSLQKDNERKGKVIPTSNRKSNANELCENCRIGRMRWDGRKEKRGQLVELVGDQSPSPKAPIKSKRGRRGGDVRRGAL